MNHLKNILILILVGAIALWSVPVGAVLKEYTILGAKGEPVPNTEVTIYDAKGKEIGKGKTNEKGVLVYDFPDKGKYELKWPGGTQAVNVPGFWTPTTIGVATGIVGAGAVALGSSGGSGSETSTTTTSTTTNGTSTPSVPSINKIPGTYTSSGTETSDSCNIWPQTAYQSDVPFSASGDQVTVSSSAQMTGTYNSTTGSFTGTGTTSQGDYGEMLERISGTFRKGSIILSGTLTLEYISGSRAGCIATYNITYTKN